LRQGIQKIKHAEALSLGLNEEKVIVKPVDGPEAEGHFYFQDSQKSDRKFRATIRLNLPAKHHLCGGFECDVHSPFLDRRSGGSYSYGFLLTGDFHLWLSELFNPTTGVEQKRMGSEQEWPRRPVGLFLNDGGPRDADV